ncbi:thiamine-phosphate kinase [Methylobacterium haplocladii]|uniref:Thiamine-monophosphate kinase n=1 Tax=Methylobacterium haplocladii TaxID=1176176 RepID=A0A512ITT9_9HYPH|nr:thiamine-phosphate kinase [Methylobacterium haplocladii]GEP01111.1 thiamine-monophosphate kinase [Methylobacterium haplocladii]GJD82929.1 Thiamine-monophosphate kinase [Methylobacterium haplocladii]GLS60936.1 thiamine-monophosphate kinase [Methylobacterium haplocladii]
MSGGRLSEEALIARYFAPLAGPGAEGLRDDAASLTPTPGQDLVVTADAIVAGIHYFPDDPPAAIARKALGVNLSDVAAKGATPRGFLLTLALPADWTEDWLAGFAGGLGAASRDFGCPLLGGDTVRANGAALIGVTAFGEVPTGAMVKRQGARPGDRICVSGTIGDAALGLRLHPSNAQGWTGLVEDTDRAFLIDRYRQPQPRSALAPVLSRHARAAMDVSDGLAGDLAKMLTGVTARVIVADVPLSNAARRAIAADPALLETALTGGDDYEILCAVPPDALDEFLAECRSVGVPMTAIGAFEAGEGPPVFLNGNGTALVFATASFSHF